MTLEQGSQLAMIIGAFFSAVMGLASLAILYITYRLNRRSQELARQSKQADVLGEYNARFSRTWEMRANADVIANPVIFYERFWSLQFDQFHSWCQGFVPHDIFYYWIASRYDDWVANKSLGAKSYREGFHETVATWKGSKFKDFITTLHDKGIEEALAFVAMPKR